MSSLSVSRPTFGLALRPACSGIRSYGLRIMEITPVLVIPFNGHRWRLMTGHNLARGQ
ncbi:uncharacterized protein BO80DRAFT_181503 [Aspergillus ibericus CBS 121593]|uniref:Uncharacterized protein n=1 Tax=Aspergillus ibericus CBS 121593 TaxID=1448316 RepID=A0A395GS60_9EURO|nr:hypothetical protein BO80DRAFT_181503 [Aspergillus ibericus CBS 121593]RAK97808.1 hypothetical protein BO80DRAFT_181503 [Aspergillus ibericus CBS 121593]